MRSVAILAALIFSSAAVAADLTPVKAPPVTPYTPAYTWNGFWIGGHVGGGVNSTNQTVTDGVISIDLGSAPKGVVGGVEAGLNYQASQQIVLGIYVEQDFASLRAGGGFGPLNTNNVSNYFGAAGARAGLLVTPTGLLYAKGGFAWVGASPDFQALGTSKAITDTSFGWQVGGGIEHRFTPNWSVNLEYDHIQAGNKQIDIGALSSVFPYRIEVVRLGAKYLF